MKMAVFYVVEPCRLMEVYIPKIRASSNIRLIHHPDDGDSKYL
jgi:hypothetical protein